MNNPPTVDTDEPTIDWLIEQLCPESSPLIDFNKKRLKDLVKHAVVEARIAQSRYLLHKGFIIPELEVQVEDTITKLESQSKQGGSE